MATSKVKVSYMSNKKIMELSQKINDITNDDVKTTQILEVIKHMTNYTEDSTYASCHKKYYEKNKAQLNAKRAESRRQQKNS